ncbi:insulin-like [Festucalex cinctus]
MAPLWLHSASVLVLLIMSWPRSGALSSQHLCGPNLVEALNMVCGDRGFFTSSRRDIDSVLRFMPPKSDESTSAGAFNQMVAFALKKKMDAMMKRDGIVEQCCHQPCGMLVLDKYCN